MSIRLICLTLLVLLCAAPGVVFAESVSFRNDKMSETFDLSWHFGVGHVLPIPLANL